MTIKTFPQEIYLNADVILCSDQFSLNSVGNQRHAKERKVCQGDSRPTVGHAASLCEAAPKKDAKKMKEKPEVSPCCVI